VPGINAIFVTSRPKVREALIKIAREVAGIEPQFHSGGPDQSADRAHYPVVPTQVIINSASGYMFERLGEHCAVMAFEVADRRKAAERAARILEDFSLEAEVHHDVQPEFPAGLLSFVTSLDLRGLAIMFWPRPEDVTDEVKQTLPERRSWVEVAK
jgi:hypothetical protein